MPQVLKPEVRERIVEAAAEELAAQGAEGATMEAIARRAGVSAGNVYRYFRDKDDLLEATLPPAFLEQLVELLRSRIESVIRTRRAGGGLGSGIAGEDLLSFTHRHRHRVVFLLARAEGSRWESFREDLVAELSARAMAELGGGPGGRPAGGDDALLGDIYRNYLRTLAALLERHAELEGLRAAAHAYARYHLTGLGAYFA